MSEHLPHHTPESTPRSTREVLPAREHDGIDWRRIDVAMGRFNNHLADGINTARTGGTEIGDSTARVIAHVLGRGHGRQSALAAFGRTGEATYEELRDEYLAIYNHPDATGVVKELIDWLGTHLVHRESRGSGRRFMNEHLPPTLDRLLVRTDVEVGGEQFTVQVPANYDSTAIQELIETLAELQLDDDHTLQAFQSLPDVNAMSGDIMQDFHDNYISVFDSPEDAVHGLLEVDEWEKEIHEFAAERHLFIDTITPDYEALLDRARDGYDLVTWKGKVYAFYQ